MARIEETVFCDGCGAEITWAPYILHEREFCCPDCARGVVCTCGDRMELGEDSPSLHPLTPPFSPP